MTEHKKSCENELFMKNFNQKHKTSRATVSIKNTKVKYSARQLKYYDPIYSTHIAINLELFHDIRQLTFFILLHGHFKEIFFLHISEVGQLPAWHKLGQAWPQGVRSFGQLLPQDLTLSRSAADFFSHSLQTNTQSVVKWTVQTKQHLG